MRFSIMAGTLLHSLASVIGSSEQKSTTPILSHVLIKAEDDKLTLSCTDMEQETISSISAAIDGEGVTAIESAKLRDIVNSYPKDTIISFILESESSALIKINRSKFKVKARAPDEYPNIDSVSDTQEFKIAGCDFIGLVNSSRYCMANQDVRYYLCGMNFEFKDGLSVAATDGHRMSMNRLDVDCLDNKGVILPRKAVLELTKVVDAKSDELITIRVSDRHFQVEIDNVTFTSKLIDGKYPDINSAVPKNALHKVTLDRKELLNCLTRSMITANEKFRGGVLSFSSGQLEIKSNNPEQENSSHFVDCNFSDDNFEIGLNLQYIIEALNNITADEVTMSFTGTTTSMMIESDDSDNKHILMPVRL